jgi:hypothetical protein
MIEKIIIAADVSINQYKNGSSGVFLRHAPGLSGGTAIR